jgi:predicted phosphodiesterase
MARIWILSDLHYECISGSVGTDIHYQHDVDLVVIAGDYHRAADAVQHARYNFPEHPLVMISGNHEHYQSRMTINAGIDRMRAAAKADRDVHCWDTFILENETVELDLKGERIRVIGATLWTDFKVFKDFERYSVIAASSMYDYVVIRGSDEDVLTPYETALRHSESRAYIKAELQKPFDGKTIVVTHHLPSMRSVAQRYKTDSLTPAFASDCSDLLELGADLWVHGHTHDSCDYFYGSTRVVCNPRGYPDRNGPAFGIENKAFDPAKIVEI